MVDIPTKKIMATETRPCKVCNKNTKQTYEEVAFHTSVLFVKLFISKKRYVRICNECFNGDELSEEEFKKEIKRITGSELKTPGLKVKSYEKSKLMGIKYCPKCGERIYPDIGYCTSCAVRKPSAKK